MSLLKEILAEMFAPSLTMPLERPVQTVGREDLPSFSVTGKGRGRLYPWSFDDPFRSVSDSAKSIICSEAFRFGRLGPGEEVKMSLILGGQVAMGRSVAAEELLCFAAAHGCKTKQLPPADAVLLLFEKLFSDKMLRLKLEVFAEHFEVKYLTALHQPVRLPSSSQAVCLGIDLTNLKEPTLGIEIPVPRFKQNGSFLFLSQ